MNREWEFRLRLFFSVDVVDSTGFKGRHAEAGAGHWSIAFDELFAQFPGLVEAGYSSLRGLVAPQDHLAVWKLNGDELLLTVQLGAFHEALSHLLAMRSALQRWPSIGSKWELALKLTGWLAGFPVGNTAFAATEDGRSEYIGPAIDLGFRLTQHADPCRCPVSADLALMLLDARQAAHQVDHLDAPAVVLERQMELKGVLAGMPYPLVWVDLDSSEQTCREARLRGLQPNHEDLRDYLAAFLDRTPGLHRPFIQGDSDDRYREVPPGFERNRQRLRDACSAVPEELSTVEPPSRGQPTEPPDPGASVAPG